jgi:hypothetical protein
MTWQEILPCRPQGQRAAKRSALKKCSLLAVKIVIEPEALHNATRQCVLVIRHIGVYHGPCILAWRKGAGYRLTPRQKKQRRFQAEDKCAICEGRRQPDAAEIYHFQDELDTYVFNVARAKDKASDGRLAVPIARETLLHLARMNTFDLNHLGHVDPGMPGIFTRRFGWIVLVDGIHRAVRCFADQQIFSAFELSYEESLECLPQQRVSVKDAEAIARKLRRALKYFPGIGAMDTPVECTAEMLSEVERLLTAKERSRFVLRAVPGLRE